MKQQTISLDDQKTKIIQEALIKLKEQVHNKIALTRRKPKTDYPILDSLVGSIIIKDKGETNYALNDDDIYLKD